MQFTNPDENDNRNIEDRRGSGGRKVAIGGVGTIIVVVIALIMGKNPMQLLNQVNNGISPQTQQSNEPYQESETEKQEKSLASNVFRSCDTVWQIQFAQMKKQFQSPTLVFYTDETATACGGGSAAMGPFYCPGDQKIYLDLSFFEEMTKQFNASGDFARAYVVAHEFGHHIQNLLGISEKLDNARGRVSEKEYNRLSVKLELQADFLAGYWAHYAKNLSRKGIVIDDADVESALNAANQIGDDMLQKKAQGRVVPDAFTHGTSAQRVFWFKKGLTTGDLNQGDTFSDPSL